MGNNKNKNSAVNLGNRSYTHNKIVNLNITVKTQRNGRLVSTHFLSNIFSLVLRQKKQYNT